MIPITYFTKTMSVHSTENANPWHADVQTSSPRPSFKLWGVQSEEQLRFSALKLLNAPRKRFVREAKVVVIFAL